MSTSWSHRIKGTFKTKGKRGDIVQYTPEEKAPIVVKNALSEFFRPKGFSPAVVTLKVEDFMCRPKGELLKGKFHHNSHTASGTITYFLRGHVNDETHEKQTSPFSIKFEDTIDEHGVPDTVVTAFDIK